MRFRSESVELAYRDRARRALRLAGLHRADGDRAEAAAWLAAASVWRALWTVERGKPYDPQLLAIRAETAAYRARLARGFSDG